MKDNADSNVMRYCSHPMKVYDSSQQGHYYKRCGSRSELFCEYCSNIYTRDKNLIISSGCEVSIYDDTITDEMIEQYSFFGLTMTAPSFGTVYNKMDIFSADDYDKLGTPKRFSTYKFKEQILWNANSSQLFHHSVKYLRASFKKEFEFVAVREWQARGVIHYHILFRVPKDDSSSFMKHLKKFKTYKYNDVYKWGVQSYISELPKTLIANTVSYFSKSLGEDVRQHGLEYKLLSDKIRNFYKKLDNTAYDLLCECGNDSVDCSCLSVKNFGFTGHLLSKSSKWSFSGLNQGILKERRKQWVDDNSDNKEHIKKSIDLNEIMEDIYKKNIERYSNIIGDNKVSVKRVENLLNNYSHIFN